MTTISQLQLI